MLPMTSRTGVPEGPRSSRISNGRLLASIRQEIVTFLGLVLLARLPIGKEDLFL